MKPNSKILIIAGSDSSGGAGIQADIKTITALGSYAMTAITAVTSQNTTGVKSIVGINPKEIFNQIIYTCKDIRPDAIKIGMLHSSEVIRMVLKALNEIKVKWKKHKLFIKRGRQKGLSSRFYKIREEVKNKDKFYNRLWNKRNNNEHKKKFKKI